MRKLTRAVFAAFLLAGAPALSSTDYKCMQECLEQNYQYGFCKSRCSYGEETQPFQLPQQPEQPPQQMPQPTQTDYQCMSQCTARGYQYGYCKSRCSF